MDGGIVYQSKEFYGDGECFMEGMANTRADPTCLQVFAFSTLLFTLLFFCVVTLAELPPFIKKMQEIKPLFQIQETKPLIVFSSCLASF